MPFPRFAYDRLVLTMVSEVKVKKFFVKLGAKLTRAFAAHCFMLTFIVLTGIGAYMILPGAGFITAGISCLLYGFLLGSE
jgi:hypothetical protein